MHRRQRPTEHYGTAQVPRSGSPIAPTRGPLAIFQERSVDELQLTTDADCFTAVSNVQLGDDRRDVMIDRLVRDVETLAQFGVWSVPSRAGAAPRSPWR
jgi:hypothetical protein